MMHDLIKCASQRPVNTVRTALSTRIARTSCETRLFVALSIRQGPKVKTFKNNYFYLYSINISPLLVLSSISLSFDIESIISIDLVGISNRNIGY